jgi:UDP-glucose 4-epimerase
MGRVVLVTGVSRDLGGRIARRLVDDPAVARVIGVDVVPPRADLGAAHFVRADIRNPVIAKVIAAQDVDTVVHAGLAEVGREAGGRAMAKEHNVIGTMQLLAACQRAPGLERIVVRSSADVYGASSRDPAMFIEEMSAKQQPRSGPGRDMVEIEGYVRGFARRRPDVSVTLLRTAEVIGPEVHSPIVDHFRLPVIPRPLGFDARLQFLHDTDLLGVLHHASLAGVHGTFNIAGQGILMLSQLIRRLGRPSVAVPGFSLALSRSIFQQRNAKLTPDQVNYLTFGRGIDTRRMRRELGFEPAYSTSEAVADFARAMAPGLLHNHPVATLEQVLVGNRGELNG